MIKVKEFVTTKQIDEEINEFLEEHPDIKVIDIKYQVFFGSKQALLIYEEPIVKNIIINI